MHRFPARVFLLLLFLIPLLSFAQDKARLHRALEQLKTEQEDTTRVKLYNDIAWDTSYDNLPVGIAYCKEGLALSAQAGFERGTMLLYNTMGTIYEDMGDYEKALDAHMKGLKLAEKNGDTRMMGTLNMNISLVYGSLEQPEKSLEHLQKSLGYYRQINNRRGIAVASSNLGAVYLNRDEFDRAQVFFDTALTISHELNNIVWEAHAYTGLAKCAQAKHDTLLADLFIKQSLQILDSLDNQYETSQTEFAYAQLLIERGNYRPADSLLQKVLATYRSIGMTQGEKQIWETLAELYEKEGRPGEALNAWKKFSSLKDSLLNENVLRHQRDLEAVYENEKKENQIRLLTKDQALQQTYLIALGGGCVLLLLFLFVLYNRSQLRKKTNELLSAQKAVIEEKNKDITDSINYARRIQEAVLPSAETLRRQFADAFILYRPRDIVSGDFWWFTENDGRFLLAVADCTGHGVPGGFMSVMGAAFLSEVINEKKLVAPDAILDELRLKVINALHHSGDDNKTVRDGMDIVMCTFDRRAGQLSFACANNPLWLIRNGELIEFKPDKFPVGMHEGSPRPFTLHQVPMEKGDRVYLFTDGYADQFGGPQGKKFKYKQLQDLLLRIHRLPASEQKQQLERTFDDWKGDLGQVDDVCVIGICIGE